MQGIGDSSQGFANVIIFVIFTKNIRDSFIKCICCKLRGIHVVEADGQIQAYSDQSHLNAISSDAKLVGDLESHKVDEKVFGNSTKSYHSGSFKKYGAVS